ncbi:MFS transporter [Saccharospirillum impatiens]|uniref:MFS transporter n=1 Tax=Saccharospirillum impatiens TaxID=169438 RepID=UPI00040E752C|nr:MFS transporter [Saccharospirillum impatiens]
MALSTPSGRAKGRTENGVLGRVYEQVVGEEDARVCKDIPESACQHQPRNFFAYLVANTFSKIADELSSARLILPWLMSALGVPLVLVGFLVPIREAGVLIPQLLVAAYVRQRAYRKPVWLLGAAMSSLGLLTIASAALFSEGIIAGGGILVGLTLYSLARGLCSVSAKDVLGKTVSKNRRGTVMGYSASLAGFALLGLGLMLVGTPGLDENTPILVGLLLVATLFWWLSMLAFSVINEAPGATEGGGNGWTVAWRQLGLLRSDSTFRFFVLSRSALLSVALMPPFYVVMIQQSQGGGLGLGALIIISGLAASLSSGVWGRFSDRSSQTVMAIAAFGASLAGLLAWASDAWLAGAGHMLSLSLAYGLIMICHGGVRLGRKAYLVDMATPSNRASYVAVSNTVVGVIMLFGGLIGLLGDIWSPLAVILLLSALAVVASVMCFRLPTVQ